MQIGDLIKFRKREKPSGNLAPSDPREHGVVLSFDIMSTSRSAVVKVLWNTGHIGWVLKERMKIAKS